MRRGNGTGTVSKLKQNLRAPYRAQKWGYDPVQQKWKYITVGYYKTKSEAERALQEFQGIKDNTKITFKEVFDEFIKERYAGREGADRHQQSAINHCKDIWEVPISKIRIEEMEAIKNRETSEHVIKRLREMFKGVFDYAVRREYIKTDYAARLRWRVDVKTKKERVMLSPLELNMLIGRSKECEMRDVILILLYTGMRPVELCDLRSSDIVMRENRINITRSKTDAGVRSIPIHRKIKPIFEKLLEKGTDRLFSLSTTKTMRLKYKEQMPKLAERSELYDFRHLFSTQLYECKIDQHISDLILGHKEKSLTLNTYTHTGWNSVLTEFRKFDYTAFNF